MELTGKSKKHLSNYSTFDLAVMSLKKCSMSTSLSLVFPVPLIAAAVYGFYYYQPKWFIDPFMWAILLFFAVGQIGAFVQLFSLAAGTRKAMRTMKIVRQAGDQPDLAVFQEKLMGAAPSCHIRDSIIRWIQLGLQGETQGIERMMEHAAERRNQTADKILSFHIQVNRVTLKLGFLGTLIGLMMTFDPMKAAMLSLQGSQGEFSFIQDIVKAIDGNAYAIVTTLFATGLSVFIEFLTLQLFERILGDFEMVNNNLDDWCLIHLQPWVRSNSEKKNPNDALLLEQERFAQRIMDLQKTMEIQIGAMAGQLMETTRQMQAIAPLQADMAKKILLLTEYEKQYRQILNVKLQTLAPAPPVERS